MSNHKEKMALLIIDMVKDNFVEAKKLPITPLAKQIIAPINHLIAAFREHAQPIVFSTDAFHEQDFIFKAVLLEDCTAAFSGSIHQNTLGLYRKNPLYPLLRVISSAELISQLTG
ncbi:MAG: isochorismatase family protein [Candidatus Aminicenantes bacterium]|nr:MAG: isochorismatase family protein [Candidatus Aminicenantes bacterium]